MKQAAAKRSLGTLAFVLTTLLSLATACGGPTAKVMEASSVLKSLGGRDSASPSPPMPLCSPGPDYTCAVIPFNSYRGFKSLPVIHGYNTGVALSRNQYDGEKVVGPTVGVGTIVPPGLQPFPGPTPLIYFTEQTPINVSMNNVSSFSLTPPTTIKLRNRQVYIAYLDPNNLSAGWQTIADMLQTNGSATFQPDFRLPEIWQTQQLYGFAVYDLPNPSPLPTGILYYTELHRITQYKAGLSANNVVGRLSGVFTQLNTRGNATFDSVGNIYVANSPAYVTEFAAGATGDVSPIHTISGSNTLLQAPDSVAVDSNGNIYVADTNYINIYPPGADGNVSPSAQLLLSLSNEIAFDASDDLFVERSGGIEEYAPGVTGTPAPIRTLNAVGPFSLDKSGNVYVCYTNSISEYLPSDISPSRTISGLFTTLACDNTITVGATGYIYAQVNGAFGGNHVVIFTPTAAGNEPPIRKIGTSGRGYLNILPNR